MITGMGVRGHLKGNFQDEGNGIVWLAESFW